MDFNIFFPRGSTLYFFFNIGEADFDHLAKLHVQKNPLGCDYF